MEEVGGNHYQKLVIQPTEYIHKNKMGFFDGNVIKYISRYKYKNGAEDVLKSIDYSTMILKNEYGIEVEIKVKYPEQ